MFAFENVANQTTLHGFHEFYHAHSIWWKVFWAVIIVGAFSMTTLQTYQAMAQFFSDPSHTTVAPAKSEEIKYPSIKVCFAHWMYWIDWNKAYKYGFSRDMFMYGLSYLTEIDSFTEFNVSETKKKFLHQMKFNNITYISQFYKLIARPFPFVNETIPYWKSSMEHTNIFKLIEIPQNFDGLCYITTREQVSKFRQQRLLADGSQFAFIIQDQNYDLISDYMTKKEYNYYVIQYLNDHTGYYKAFSYESDYLEFKQFALPFNIYPEGHSYFPEVGFESASYFYYIGMSAYRLKQLRSKPCSTDLIWISGNKSETEACKAANYIKFCQCPILYFAIKAHADIPENLCPKRIRFIKNGTLIESDQKSEEQICTENQTYVNELKNCLQQIPTPCETWSYTIVEGISKLNSKLNEIMQKNYTFIYVAYPNPSQVLITTEIDAQTWDSFIGSIGGVVGIWTGASLLSFVQLFYICCSSSKQDNLKISLWKRSTKAKEIAVKLIKYDSYIPEVHLKII